MFNEIFINEEMLPKYTYIYIYIYMNPSLYIYIYRERERERERYNHGVMGIVVGNEHDCPGSNPRLVGLHFI